MATTTNYGWTTPNDTDLVKDGASAIRTLGNSIDTTTKNLNPETTTGDIAYRSATANTNTRLPIGTNGQILAVSSGVPAWINNDQGDITEVQAGTGISVASGTGPIPVVTNTVATAIDAKGDLIVGTGADTFARLAVGTNGHTLVADSGAGGGSVGMKWAAPSAGALTLITSDTFTSISSKSYNNCFSATYLNYLILVNLTTSGSVNLSLKLRASGTDNSSNYRVERIISNFNGLTRQSNGLGTDEAFFGVGPDSSYPGTYNEVKLMNPFATQGTGFIASSATNEQGGTTQSLFGGVHADITSYDGFTIFFTGTSSGSLQIYGLGI